MIISLLAFGFICSIAIAQPQADDNSGPASDATHPPHDWLSPGHEVVYTQHYWYPGYYYGWYPLNRYDYPFNDYNRYDIGGTWYMGGPYNVGMPCQIIQDGSNLVFVNENGQKSSGGLVDPYTVVATDWENGLRGTLTWDKNRIDWANGTWWVRGRH